MGLRNRKLIIVGVTATLIGFGGFVLFALSKMQAGHGPDTYRNYRGAFLNHNAALVMAGVFALCVAGAYIARWWHHRQERKYEEIIRARAANTEPRKTTETGS